eukprot:scaffold89899_cov60-Phaeocystis_antarctica.AAC.1
MLRIRLPGSIAPGLECRHWILDGTRLLCGGPIIVLGGEALRLGRRRELLTPLAARVLAGVVPPVVGVLRGLYTAVVVGAPALEHHHSHPLVGEKLDRIGVAVLSGPREVHLEGDHAPLAAARFNLRWPLLAHKLPRLQCVLQPVAVPQGTAREIEVRIETAAALVFFVPGGHLRVEEQLIERSSARMAADHFCSVSRGAALRGDDDGKQRLGRRVQACAVAQVAIVVVRGRKAGQLVVPCSVAASGIGVEHGRLGVEAVRAAGWNDACRSVVYAFEASHLQPTAARRCPHRRQALLLSGTASAC